MKRLSAMLSATLFTLSLSPLTAFAGEAELMGRFFPSGAIPTPTSAPYLSYQDVCSDGSHIPGSINFFYDVPDELTAICNEITLEGDFAFEAKYRLAIENGISIQIDAKFDDGAWLSEGGDWEQFEYGEGLRPENECFFLNSFFLTDDTTKTHYFTQSSMTYFDETKPENAFLTPYVIKDEATGSYLYDLNAHTISYRYRYYIPYRLTDSGANQKGAVFSEWSPVASIGKESNLPTLEAPTSVEAPSVMEFSTKFQSETFCDLNYYLTIPRSIYDGQKYFVASSISYDPYSVETQVRINGGEWVNVYRENAAWLSGGYCTASYNHPTPLAPDTLIEFRARMVCHALDDMASEWSEPIFNFKAPTETVPSDAQFAEDAILTITETTTTPVHEREQAVCSLCGSCPIQPLGVCLYLFVSILLVIVIIPIAVMIYLRKKKKRS